MFVLNEANSVVLKVKRKVFGNATGTFEKMRERRVEGNTIQKKHVT